MLHPSRRPEFWDDLLLDQRGHYPVDGSVFVAAPRDMLRIDPRAAETATASGIGPVPRPGP